MGLNQYKKQIGDASVKNDEASRIRHSTPISHGVKRLLSASASALVLGSAMLTTSPIGISPAYADCPVVTAAESPVTFQNLGTGTECTVENGASIVDPFGGILSSAPSIITNLGEISITADGTGISASAGGSEVRNLGLISIEGGVGIFVGGINNTIENAGTISTNGSGGTDRGVIAFDFTTLLNSGLISVDGNGGFAISVGGPNSTILNTGTLITTGDFARTITSFEGTLTNTGLIEARGTDAFAFGLVSGSTIINRGTIRSLQSDALFGDSATIILAPGSIISGGINFTDNGSTVSVLNGLSVNYTLNNMLPATLNTFGAPSAISGLQVAVVDPTTLSMQDEVITDLTNSISNSVFQAIAAARNGAGGNDSGIQALSPISGLTGYADIASPQSTSSFATRWQGSGNAPGVDSGTRFWGKGFGSQRAQASSGAATDADYRQFGTILGFDTQLSGTLYGGAFLGGSTGQVTTEFGTQETDVDSFFGGLYLGTQWGGTNVDVALTGGWTDNERSREVANNLVAAGLETATADYDGFFVSPEVSVAWESGPFVPSARIRYAGYFLDGFTETGTAAPLTVNDRDLHLLQGRFQVAMPLSQEHGSGGVTYMEPYLGVEARTILSGDTIDGVLLGQNLNFDPGGESEGVSFYGGFSGVRQLSQTQHLFADLEFGVAEQGTFRVGGGLGLRIRF